MQVTVEDVMTRSPVAVAAQATIEEVLNTLVTEGIPSVYVTTPENRLAGIVTDYDVLKHQVLGGDPAATAESLMSRTIATVGPQENAMSVCPQFREARLARMAVVDTDGHLIGNLSRRDVMRMMLALERVESDAGPRVVPAPRGAAPAFRKPVPVC